MLKSTLCVAVLAVLGFASVSAGWEKMFKGGEGGEDDRRLCGPKVFDDVAKCCKVPEVVTTEVLEKCNKAEQQEKSKFSGRMTKKSKGKKKPKSTTTPAPAQEEVAPGKTKRHAGSGEEGSGKKRRGGPLGCALNATNLITDKKFNSDAYATAFKALDTANAYSSSLDSIIADCQKKADAAAAANPEGRSCPTKMYLCIRKGLLENCASQTTGCSADELKKCNPFTDNPHKDGKKFKSEAAAMLGAYGEYKRGKTIRQRKPKLEDILQQ